MTDCYVQNRGDWPIDTIGGPARCVNAVGNFGAVFSVIALQVLLLPEDCQIQVVRANRPKVPFPY